MMADHLPLAPEYKLGQRTLADGGGFPAGNVEAELVIGLSRLLMIDIENQFPELAMMQSSSSPWLVTLNSSMSSHPPRRGAYGIDAPYAPLLMALGGACLLGLCIWRLSHGAGMAVTPYRISVIALGFGALWLFLNAGIFVYTTRIGKFAVWAELLDRLELKGDERLLDIGCGRGAVLLMAAQRLPRGRAIGVDIWSTRDQSGNAEQVTRRNAALEGVAERVELRTADMRQLPFDDGSFDVVVSSLAIHNVPGAGERAKALREAARVLKQGGKLAIADIRHTRAYASELAACGLTITDRRSLGVRFWYTAGPWAATRLVAAIKP
jgi:arsenite methyltransferase